MCQHRRQQELCPREIEKGFCWQTQKVTGRQRESLGWRAASRAQETWPRPPVALQIIFPDLLWGFWFSATRCSVSCHTEVSEQLSIHSCRAQLTQAEHSKAGLLRITLVMHGVGVKPKSLQPWNYRSASELNQARTLPQRLAPYKLISSHGFQQQLPANI